MRYLVLTVAIAIAILAAPALIEAAPRAAQPAETTERIVREAALHYEQSRILNTFDGIVPKDVPWREAARQFLERGSHGYVQDRGEIFWLDRASEGMALYMQGCRDPMVLMLTATALNSAGVDSRWPMVEEVWAAAADSPYPPLRRALLGVIVAENRPAEGQETDALWAQINALFADAAMEPGLSSTELGYIFGKLMGRIGTTLPLRRASGIVEHLEAARGMDPWIVHMARGQLEYRLAWLARGNGSANTVTQARWAAFRHHMTRSSHHFQTAHELRPELPYAAGHMILVAMAGYSTDDKPTRYWFEQATAARFDYAPAYSNFTWSLRPRWGGSHSAMFEFGLECAQTGRYDTDVPRQFLQVLKDITEETGDWEGVFRHEGVYEAVHEILTDTIAVQPERRVPDTSLLAAIAWRAGRYADSRKYWEAVGREFDHAAALRVRALGFQMATDVYAYTSPASAFYKQADEANANGEWRRAAELCEEAARLNSAGHGVIQFAAGMRLAEAKLKADFESGRWTPLNIPPEGHGWEQYRRGWFAAPDGGLHLYLDAAPRIISRAKVGNRLEVRGAFAFDRGDPAPTAVIEMVFGFDPIGVQHNELWRYVRFDQAASQVQIGLAAERRGRKAINVELKPENTFHVQSTDHSLVVRLNDAVVYRGEWPEYPDIQWRPGTQFGFGGYGERKDDGAPVVARLRNLEVRKLDPEGQAATFERPRF